MLHLELEAAKPWLCNMMLLRQFNNRVALSSCNSHAFSEKIVAASNANNHQQKGDPDKLAQALLSLSNDADVPPRFLAGSDAINMANSRLATLGAELQNWEILSRSTDNG
jgi:hypothetical protein